MNGRTRDRSIRAEHAAVASLWFEHLTTTLALIKPLAEVGGHGLTLGMPALRAGYGRFRDWRRHAAPLRFDQIVLKSALICLHALRGP